jgi:hypothetical protein
MQPVTCVAGAIPIVAGFVAKLVAGQVSINKCF